MQEQSVYYKYSQFLKDKYGEKVYKLPINLNITCPNRDGTIGTGGCYFCSALGTGFESLDAQIPVHEQLEKNRAYIGKKYGARKFIAYFQNYTNTYMPIEDFKRYMYEACQDIVELVISTRPDCISSAHLEILKGIKTEKGIQISIELGLQTANDETLVRINRGHNVESFIHAVKLIQHYDFDICVHLILNLPGEHHEDALNSAFLMNKLGITQVKLHALYIARGTVFEALYLKNEIEICSKDTYIERVILFLENLNPNIAVQRLISRAPQEETVFCNWGTSWWKIHEEIEEKMKALNTFQGKFERR